ncbi:Polysaccharide pyruvyl transferase family protein WcaK [Paenibacillus sophorae]|uniref:Polysaccharide pyruvyl transferase family protein n=1 Tax=Paenibacillus sophorae TaxID=1333845 RepID=A0A1H8RNL5_9BACL|nr:polysaccharide pyruvyl transferase family protein [Paenibacillus sophorae]QWU17048.1 polysaccharide pyruvyl transferase family protein [Paenibacillus sophorae]SEO67877.1 Polysaccharide pyruvyl transferase family protein WcaK [Paenibacillus sophorae]
MKIMMFAHGGSLNRGCEAIVRSSTQMIKENISGARVFLASEQPDTDRVIPSLDGIYDGSKSEIAKPSLNWIMSAVRFKLLGDESYATGIIERNTISRIKDVDVCLSIGGDNYCYGEQPGWYEIDRRVKRQGKKLVLWGCSIGEEDMTDRKLEDLKRFDLILARESLTYNMLREQGLLNARLCADPAFTMEKEELPLPDGWQPGNTIGVNFSPLVSSRNKQAGSAVRELLSHILKTTDMTIALTPHVMVDGNNDYELLRLFHEEFKDTGRVILLPDHLTAVQYKGYIARMRFFIGARTHATIAAYSNFVPTMVLGYSVKSKGIAKDLFGEEKLVLGIGEISSGSNLIAKFSEMLVEEEEIKAALRQSVPRIQQMSYKAVDYLKELA